MMPSPCHNKMPVCLLWSLLPQIIATFCLICYAPSPRGLTQPECMLNSTLLLSGGFHVFIFSFHLTTFFQSELFVSYLSSGVFSKDAPKASSDGALYWRKQKRGQHLWEVWWHRWQVLPIAFPQVFEEPYSMNIQKVNCVGWWLIWKTMYSC